MVTFCAQLVKACAFKTSFPTASKNTKLELDFLLLSFMSVVKFVMMADELCTDLRIMVTMVTLH